MSKPTHRIMIELENDGYWWTSKDGSTIPKDASIFKDAIIEELPREIEVGDWVLVPISGIKKPVKVAAVTPTCVCYCHDDILYVTNKPYCVLATPPEGEA